MSKSKDAKSLANLSYADLAAEVNRRRRGHNNLIRRWQTQMRKLQAIEDEMIEAGIEPPPHGVRSSRNGSVQNPPLHELLWEIMGDDKVWSPTELTQKALAAGYRTTAKNFRVQVNTTLAKNDHYFERMAPGKYRRLPE